MKGVECACTGKSRMKGSSAYMGRGRICVCGRGGVCVQGEEDV